MRSHRTLDTRAGSEGAIHEDKRRSTNRRIRHAPHALYCMRLVRGCPEGRRGEEYGELSIEFFAAEDEVEERSGIRTDTCKAIELAALEGGSR